MWLCKVGNTIRLPADMADTITRCLSDGWREIPDPTVAPVAPETEIVVELVEAQLVEVHTRNDQARAAFGKPTRNKG